MEFMFEWEADGDRFSFEDSDRFEDDSLCSWISEPESLCNNWRGWRKPNCSTSGSTAGTGSVQSTIPSTQASATSRDNRSNGMCTTSGRRSSDKVGRWALVEGGGSLGRALNPSPVLGIQGCYHRQIFENIGANLCNLVHFGAIRSSKVGWKIDAFKWDGIYHPCRIGSAAPGITYYSVFTF